MVFAFFLSSFSALVTAAIILWTLAMNLLYWICLPFIQPPSVTSPSPESCSTPLSAFSSLGSLPRLSAAVLIPLCTSSAAACPLAFLRSWFRTPRECIASQATSHRSPSVCSLQGFLKGHPVLIGLPLRNASCLCAALARSCLALQSMAALSVANIVLTGLASTTNQAMSSCLVEVPVCPMVGP